MLVCTPHLEFVTQPVALGSSSSLGVVAIASCGDTIDCRAGASLSAVEDSLANSAGYVEKLRIVSCVVNARRSSVSLFTSTQTKLETYESTESGRCLITHINVGLGKNSKSIIIILRRPDIGTYIAVEYLKPD